MKITGVETVLFEPAWDDPHAGRFRRTHAALRVRTDAGLTGNSRTSGQGAKIVADYLAPALVGEDPRNTERLWARMTRVTREAGVLLILPGRRRRLGLLLGVAPAAADHHRRERRRGGRRDRDALQHRHGFFLQSHSQVEVHEVPTAG